MRSHRQSRRRTRAVRAAVLLVVALCTAGTAYVTGAGGVAGASLTPGGSTVMGTGKSLTDGTVTATFALPGRPSASSLYLGVELRSTVTDLYRAKARVYPDGTVSVDLSKVQDGVERYLGSKRVGLAVGTGPTTLVVEGHVSGTSPATVQGRVWRSGTSVPDWQNEIADKSGLVGGTANGWAYLSQRAAAPLAVQITAVTAKSDSEPVGPILPRPSASTSPIGTVAPTTKPTPAPSATTGSPSTTYAPSPSPSGNVVAVGGTQSFSDFGKYVNGVYAGTYVSQAGLVGTGTGSMLRMVPRSSTKAGAVPTSAGSTNQLYLMALDRDGVQVEGFTLEGTDQGHLYNGVRMHQIDNGRFKNLKLVNTAPGDSYLPPGETFAINDFRGSNNTFTNVEIDGAGRGASAFGANSSYGGTWTDVSVHDNPHSAAIALWQTTGTQELVRFTSARNRTAVNLERVQGTVNIRQPTIQSSGAQDVYVGNDWGSTKVNIYDPILPAGAKIRVYYPAQEMGNKNQQLKSDVRVFRNGVDVTSTTIQWMGA